MERTHWQNAIIVGVGLWLIGATLFLNVTPADGAGGPGAMWNFILVGVAIIALAVTSLLSRQSWEEWSILLLSIWLALSPWILGSSDSGTYVTTALGSAAIVAVVSGMTVLWSGGSSQY